MKVELPFGIEVVVENGSGSVCSDLKEEGCLWVKGEGRIAKAWAEGVADAIESLLMALACAGVDIHTKQFAEALELTVDSLAQN